MTALVPDRHGGEPRPGVVSDPDRDPHALIDLAVADGPTGPVVVVAGELDTYTNGALRRQLAALEQAGTEVVVDLRGVTFADSSTLGLLLAEHRRLRAVDRALVLRDPGPAVRRVLELAGLLRVFDVRSTPPA